MAYQEYSITTLADIPSIVASFAASNGWSVTTVGGNPRLRSTDFYGAGTGGPTMELAYETPVSTSVGYASKFVDLTWKCTSGEFSDVARLRSPLLCDVANPTQPVVRSPTKLFLITGLDPEPYFAIVVQFGYNLYRHLYLGFMEMQGTYTGGLVISACNSAFVNTASGVSLKSQFNQYLFNGWNSWGNAGDNGGVYVVAAENATPFRRFRVGVGPATIPSGGEAQLYTRFNGTEVLGGFKDGLDGYVAKGKNSLAGAAVLVPCNLAITRMLPDEVRFRPIGRPPGVRMINIQDIEPEAQVTVASENWYSFAAYSKNPIDNSPRYAGGAFFRGYETSYFLGYAYKG